MSNLKATKRNLVGKNPIKQVRAENYVPGVLYGHHIDNVNLKVTQHDLDQFLKHHHIGSSFNLNVDGEETFVLFKDVQFNRLRKMTYHVEFQALSKGEKIKVKVPIVFSGKETIPAGLILQELHTEVEMQSLPKDLLDNIAVTLENVKAGDQLTIADIPVLQGDTYDLIDHKDTVIYSIIEPSLHQEEVDTDVQVSAEVPLVGEE